NSIGVYEAEYAINYSPFDGVLIDSFRVYYTTTSTTEQESFNLVDFSISGASTAPVASQTAPSVSATGTNPGFTEGGSAVDLFSGVTAATNDDGQTFTGMTLRVTNVSNGGSEILTISGMDIALSHDNSGTIAGIGSFSVSVSGTTATLTLSGMALSNAQTATLIDG